jgi:hypothetical protein
VANPIDDQLTTSKINVSMKVDQPRECTERTSGFGPECHPSFNTLGRFRREL